MYIGKYTDSSMILIRLVNAYIGIGKGGAIFDGC
jgi:hypothetical protein